MHYHNTVVSVLALLSAHSDVVHSAPSNFQGHQTRENLGGRAAGGATVDGTSDIVVSTGPKDVEARAATYLEEGTLEARGGKAIETISDITTVVNLISACAGLGLIGITYAAIAGRITIRVAESGRMRNILTNCGITPRSADRAVERLENGMELIEEVAPSQAGGS